MQTHICSTCGTGWPPAEAPPDACPICEDERQYVPPTGQSWTTLDRLRRTHKALFHYEGEFLGLGVTPAFGIGQRALIVRTPQGNILWDCIAFVDDATIDIVKGLGGLAGIAISHPHYYTSMVDWSDAFGGVPVHLHADDRQWVMRASPRLVFWEGERNTIAPGVTLVRCGGHFDGGAVMHVTEAANGKGALLVGDILQVGADRKHVGLLRSYPNFLPLGVAAVRAVARSLDGLAYDAVYGAFWNRVIAQDGSGAVARSFARQIDWLERGA